MSTNTVSLAAGLTGAEIPFGIQILCSELSHTARVYLRKIAPAIDEIAPKPGVLVYVQAKKLPVRISGLKPVVFSAIDVSTHLQVAQAYLALTTAAAVSFVDFAVDRFPFPLSHIRTRDQIPFHTASARASRRDFTAMMARRGYVHSVIGDPSRDVLFFITSRLMLGGGTEGSLVPANDDALQGELRRFLIFHNNYRCIPWLEGKTPVQKLKTFAGFEHIHTFDQDAEDKARPERRNSEALAWINRSAFGAREIESSRQTSPVSKDRSSETSSSNWR
jgi:hypothetical protein